MCIYLTGQIQTQTIGEVTMTTGNSRTLLNTVEGPKGKAELFEVVDGGPQPVYEVVCGGTTQSFKSMGEAYITCGELVGTKT